jgi:hypothetical protein
MAESNYEGGREYMDVKDWKLQRQFKDVPQLSSIFKGVVVCVHVFSHQPFTL